MVAVVQAQEQVQVAQVVSLKIQTHGNEVIMGQQDRLLQVVVVAQVVLRLDWTLAGPVVTAAH